MVFVRRAKYRCKLWHGGVKKQKQKSLACKSDRGDFPLHVQPCERRGATPIAPGDPLLRDGPFVMPALDPFSASSRPMLPFDTIPSRPLPFAATLHPIDLGSAPNSLPQKLPKARRHKEPAPKSLPLPQYRQSPSTSSSFREDGAKPVVVGSDEWMQIEIARCVDSAKGDLDISWVL